MAENIENVLRNRRQRMPGRWSFERSQQRISVILHGLFLLQMCFIILFFEDRTTEQLLRFAVQNSMLLDNAAEEMKNTNLLANLYSVFVQQWSSKMSDAIGPLFIRFINVNTRKCNPKSEFQCLLPILFDDIAVERQISRDMSELPTWRLTHCNGGVLKMSFKEDSEESRVSSARCFTCSYPSAGHVLVVPKFTHNSSLYERCFSEIVDCMHEQVRDGFMHPELRFIQFSLAFRDRQTDIFYEVYLTFERIVAWNWRHTSRIELGYIRGAFQVGNFHNSADSIYITLLTLSVLAVVIITLWDFTFVFKKSVLTSEIFWFRQVVNILLISCTAVTLKNHFWMVFNFKETIDHIETDGRERRISPFLHLQSLNNQLLSATLALSCAKLTLYDDYFFATLTIFVTALRKGVTRSRYFFCYLVFVYVCFAQIASLLFRRCGVRIQSFLDAVIYTHLLLTGNEEDMIHGVHMKDPRGHCKTMEVIFKIALQVIMKMILLTIILSQFLGMVQSVRVSALNRRNRLQRRRELQEAHHFRLQADQPRVNFKNQ